METDRYETKIQNIAVFLPLEMVEREVTGSHELVQEDLRTLNAACRAAWTRFKEFSEPS